jgi:hypothetical protein
VWAGKLPRTLTSVFTRRTIVRIKYLSTSPKAGQVDHVNNAVGATLIAAGFAEAMPYTDFRQRLAAETPQAFAVAAPEVSWGVQERHLSRFGLVVVVKKVGSETTYYSAPPDDAPGSIKQRFAELNQTPLDPEVAEEARIQAGYRQNAQEKQEKVGVMRTLFGNKTA